MNLTDSKIGNLTDREIGAEMAAGRLIRNGEHAQIGPGCYELRMGRAYYDLTEGARRFDVGEGGKVLIKPGHRVVLITQEELIIPPNMIARIISKGSLFSVGLSPVCTYADPGFRGNVGVVTQNISDKYIELPVGESIAKVDVAWLSNPVDHPYRGQHGYQTEIWPIKYQLQKTYAEVRNDPRVQSEKAEAYKLLPQATADLLRGMEKRQRLIDVAITVFVLVNAALLCVISTRLLDTMIGIVGNLIASAIVVMIGVVSKWRRDTWILPH
jgi:dCTP deaminase